jgi:predicted nucleic acid-binding protein
VYTLDASIFTRTIDPTEPAHRDCLALLERLHAAATPIVVPTLVLAEVAGAVSRARRDAIRARVVAATLRALPHVTFVALDDELAQQAADLAADHHLRGADAVYVAVARQVNAILVTLDEEQRTRAAPLIPTRSPAEALAELLPPTP